MTIILRLIRLGLGRRHRLCDARAARTSAALGPRPGRRTCACLCAAGTGFRAGLWPQPVAHGGLHRRLIGLIEILQLWAPGRHARLEDFVVDALAAASDSRAAALDWRSAHAAPASSPATQNPRGTPAREDPFGGRLSMPLVDDLDDLARARLHDHAAIVDDRITVFGVARHRPQFDGCRQRLTDDYRSRTTPTDTVARNRSDHGVRNFQA